MKKILLFSLLSAFSLNSHALSLAYDFNQDGSYDSSYAIKKNQFIDINIYARDVGAAPDGLVGMGFRLEFDSSHLQLISSALNTANWDIAGISNSGSGFIALSGSSFNAFSGNVLLGQVQFQTINDGVTLLNLFDFDKGGSSADFVTENNNELDSTLSTPYIASLNVPTPPSSILLLAGLGFGLLWRRKKLRTLSGLAALLVSQSGVAAPVQQLILQTLKNEPPRSATLLLHDAQGQVIQPLSSAHSRKKASNYIEGEVIVTFKKGVSALQSDTATQQLAMEQVQSYPQLSAKLKGKRLALLKSTSHESTAQMLAKLKNDATVESASPNYIKTISTCSGTTPNDTNFASQWAWCNQGQTGGTSGADIQATDAWQLHSDSSSAIVAVIDTGVAYNHGDLSPNMWRNTAELNGVANVDDDHNGYIDDIYGIDVINQDSDPMDDHSHGTHVSGTISAASNNAKGVSGVNWNAKIMALKFLAASGSGSTEGAIEAINYAITMKNKGHNVVAINASYGCSDCFSQPEKDAIDAAGAAGILFVAASGNDGQNSDTQQHHYPADYTSSNLISVTATDHNDALAGFSNYGAISVDLAAPGVSIFSTVLPTFNASSTVYSNDIEAVTVDTNCPSSNWCSYGYDVSNAANPTLITGTWAATSEAAFAGTKSLSDSPNGNYANSTRQFLESPAIDLQATSGEMAVSFRAQLNLENGFDYLGVYVCSDSLNICESEGYLTGALGTTWGLVRTAIRSSSLRRASDAQIVFAIISDKFVNADGVHIDDVSIEQGTIVDNYGSKNGTSMAAPHVAGAAAFLASAFPSENIAGLRARLLNSGDNVAAVTGKTVTGKRLNLVNALSAVDVKLNATASSVQPLIGNNFDLIVNVSNTSLINATGVVIQSALPSGFSYVSDTSGGSYNSGTGLWQLGTLTANGTAQLRIRVTANSSTPAAFGAEVLAQNEFDADSTPNNHNAQEDDQASITLKAQARVIANNSCRGDFDNDGDVDNGDKTVFLAAFRAISGQAAYNASADFDSDGDVDNADFSKFRSDYGRTDCLN